MREASVDIPAALIRIGTLARLSGTTVSHLRRLSDQGLVPAFRIGPGLHRRYPREAALRRVRELLKLAV